ncbi:MAG TPA: hypothetical protein VG347_01505 [Verrucomicrobiae bacterium]|nr:hypothetical protein [Verrucomicrobiae bacterium]
MIHPAPYRRLRLTDCDSSIAGTVTGPGFALACHKGDASQTQQNEEQGAQTGGVAIKGNTSGAVAGSGNAINVSTGSDDGWGWLFGNKPTNSVTKVTSTINNGVSASDIGGFVSQLVSALTPTPAPTTAASDGTPAPVLNASSDATGSTTPANTISRGVVVSVLLAVVLFIVGVVFLFTRKPKKS